MIKHLTLTVYIIYPYLKRRRAKQKNKLLYSKITSRLILIWLFNYRASLKNYFLLTKTLVVPKLFVTQIIKDAWFMG